ncbi:hypothetical protein MMC12_000381 [Toensbergia leucococca]|nr:hypothetical protein [Toensbergia leucococca]
MHMKSTHSAESGTRGITGSTRRHIYSRIHKASVHAGCLVALLRDKELTNPGSEAVLEARAYHVSLLGSAEFEKQNWEKCLKAYSEARLIYTTLARSLNMKQDDVFRELLTNTIDPSIRYAAYQMKLPRTLSIDSIVMRYVPSTGNEYIEGILKQSPDVPTEEATGTKALSGDSEENLPRSITWRSRTIKLEDAAISQALASVSVAEQRLASLLSENIDSVPRIKASAYDEILVSSQDAVDATKTAIDELSAEGVAQGDPRMQALQITRTAVNYALVGWRIGRNRVLSGEQDGAEFEPQVRKMSKKPRKDEKEVVQKEESNGRKLARLKERVVLYDATLQSLQSVKELPGVASDQAFGQELEAKRVYFAALRCLAIARSYILLAKTKNALALLARALDLSSQTSPALLSPQTSTNKPPNLDLTLTQANSLHQLLQGLVTQQRALVELHSLDFASASATLNNIKQAAPLIRRLDEYPKNGADLTNLVTYPPKVEPIPVKPLFLDLAWSHIDYPGRQRQSDVSRVNGAFDDAQGKVGEKKEARKGWFGFGR